MSPAATLDATEVAAAAVRVADELFYHRGVAAVTMAEIRDRSGVSFRRLYSMYPSKSDLVGAWLRQRHHDWMAAFAGHIARQRQDGQSPVEAIFGAIEAWMIETDFRGCGFINTHAESGELSDEHVVTIQMHKRAVADYLETLTPHGRTIAVIIDGAIVQAAIFRSVEPIHRARGAASTLTAAGPPDYG